MKKTLSDKIGIILFLLPAIILFILFFVYPVGFVMFTSFMKWDGLSEMEFVGLANFKKLMTDKVFLSSIKNNVMWSMSGGFIHVPMAALAAILISKKPKGWKFLRTIYFFPNIISLIAIGMMWKFIYSAESYGLLNNILGLVGLESLQRNWLGDPNTAFPALICHWIFNIGYFMVIILAQITTIPKDLYEAAEIDGAGAVAKEIHITLPMIKETVFTCMILSMTNGLKHFETVLVMTNGGPANKTSMLSLYLFKQIANFKYGLANASGVILIVVGVCVIVGLNKLKDLSNVDWKARRAAAKRREVSRQKAAKVGGV